MSESQQPDPKIIVDEDWKSQVEAEKQAAQTSAAQSHGSKPQDVEPERYPPASFEVLVSTLATQALAGMGVIPDPIEDRPVVRKGLAKHMIDMLALIDQKTAGNLTPDESAMLTSTLYQLRMAFVEIRDRPADAAPSKPSIELP